MVVEHLVVDSAGFIKNANIKDIGKEIYTTNEVVNEIRDRPTRRRLAVLPYEIKFKQPQQKCIEKVREVAKVTGDFNRLSLTDIKVLALTYELSKQCGESVKEDVEVKDILQVGSLASDKEILPGFYTPKNEDKITTEQDEDGVVDEMDKCNIDEEQKESGLEEDEDQENESLEEEEDDDDDDDDGWITPSNIKQLHEEENKDVVVACMTTDFAMQNVLRKMNLKVISIDGMMIQRIQTAVLRCHACFEITKIMSKKFCPKCGNLTLKRVPVSIQEDGSTKYYLSRRPNILNPRGTKYSLPMPRGGKHSTNPVLCEDQPIPHNRPSKKAMQRTDVWSEDYNIDGTPFAVTDTQSKSFRLGIRNGGGSNRRNNPNQNKGRFSRKR